jgi:hypothetical protein
MLTQGRKVWLRERNRFRFVGPTQQLVEWMASAASRSRCGDSTDIHPSRPALPLLVFTCGNASCTASRFTVTGHEVAYTENGPKRRSGNCRQAPSFDATSNMPPTTTSKSAGLASVGSALRTEFVWTLNEICAQSAVAREALRSPACAAIIIVSSCLRASRSEAT